MKSDGEGGRGFAGLSDEALVVKMMMLTVTMMTTMTMAMMVLLMMMVMMTTIAIKMNILVEELIKCRSKSVLLTEFILYFLRQHFYQINIIICCRLFPIDVIFINVRVCGR